MGTGGDDGRGWESLGDDAGGVRDPFEAARARLVARLSRTAGARLDVPVLDDLVEEIDGLAPLPAVATRILQLGEDHQFSAHELAAVIAADQGLTARILRLANSAYYGAPRRIGTVRDAVVLLGFRAVRQVAVASCVASAPLRLTNLDREGFWRHSVATGLLAELAARVAGQGQDAAFTAGVLHNVGRLALDQHRPELLAESVGFARTEQVTLHAAERAVLGFTDAELGGALALHWGFPEELVVAIRDHEALIGSPPAVGSAEEGSLAAVVARARVLARTYGVSDAPLDAAVVVEVDPFDPLVISLEQGGGVDRILERADAFIASALG